MADRRIFFGLILFLTIQVAHSAESSPPSEVSASANTGDGIYIAAERSFLKNDFQAALEKLNQYFSEKEHGKLLSPKTMARAFNLKGLIYFQLKNINASIQEFDHAVSIAVDNFPPSDPSLHLARYNLANALHQAGRTEEAAALLQQIFPGALDLDTRIRFFHLEGNIYTVQEQGLASVLAYLHAAQIARDPVLVNAFLQRAFSASKKVFLQNPQSDVEQLSQFATELDPNAPTALGLQLILARGHTYLGQQGAASNLVAEFLAKAAPDHPLHSQALELQQQMERLSVVDPTAIGILVPLSGKFGKFGRLCLNAALMALGAFEDMPMGIGEGKYHFVIKDSGENPETALLAFDQLVFDDHVVAVIGPLLSKQGGSVSQKAQEYGVPLFSLSQRNDKGKAGSYVFPIALSPSQQIDIIADYAIEKQGRKRFAIMAPADNFGDEYVKLFWDAVESRNGKIMAVERYAPKSTDFKDEMKSMLGLRYPEARALEVEELHRRSEIFASHLKARGLTRKRMLQAFDLKPVVDFDAVFIPDDPQVVGQIAPSFAIHEIERLPFLGINTWNNPEIIQRAGRYVQNSLFVDAFFAQSQDPKVQHFLDDFRQFYGILPGTLEVQSYDASRILLTSLTRSEVLGRAQLQQNILGLGKFEGTSGDFEFSETGIKRSAYLLTVSGNAINEIPQR